MLSKSEILGSTLTCHGYHPQYIVTVQVQSKVKSQKSKVKRTWSDSILLLYHDVYSLMHFYSDVLERWDNQDVLDVPREERVLLMQCLD